MADEVPSEMRKVTYFFFQAEDGIRSSPVTGVQTCALPFSVPSVGLPMPSIGSAVPSIGSAVPSIGLQIGLVSWRERV
mgnify:CR=1 FL=1